METKSDQALVGVQNYLEVGPVVIKMKLLGSHRCKHYFEMDTQYNWQSAKHSKVKNQIPEMMS